MAVLLPAAPTRRRLPAAALAILCGVIVSSGVPVAAQTHEEHGEVHEQAMSDSVPDELQNPRVAIELEKGGEIVIELLPDEAPLAVERFLLLVGEGFYDGLVFHRVESWIVQTGAREHEYPPIEGEMFFQNLRHEPGMVGMARLVDDYDSATTQFYIIRERKAVLNKEYTLFATVVAGMDLVMKIEKGVGIRSVRVVP